VRIKEFISTDNQMKQSTDKVKTDFTNIPNSLYDLFSRVSTISNQGIDQVLQTYLSPGSKEGFIELPVTSRLATRGLQSMNLQRALIALGYDVGTTKDDGIIGSRTKAGILKFQQDNGLPPSGIPNINTVAAINATLDTKPQILNKLKKAEPEEYKGKISVSHLGDSQSRKILTKEAEKQGLKGKELAAFLAQCSHESGGFRYLSEIWGPSLQQQKYEGRRDLGNTQKGDGYRYRGRGFLMLSGRVNYHRAGTALGLPLETDPDLVSTKEVAAQVAVWKWKTDVSPKISNWDDTKKITRIVNGGYNGYYDRLARYTAFKQELNLA
jgi:putative chitinase